jgi:hypothetical protein
MIAAKRKMDANNPNSVKIGNSGRRAGSNSRPGRHRRH